jgi:hypothetical protein
LSDYEYDEVKKITAQNHLRNGERKNIYEKHFFKESSMALHTRIKRTALGINLLAKMDFIKLIKQYLYGNV